MKLQCTHKNDSSTVQYTDQKFFQSLYDQFTKKEISGENIISNLENFYYNLTNYPNNRKIISCYQNFLGERNTDDYSILKSNVIKNVDYYQKNQQYFQLKNLFLSYLREILDPNKIQKKIFKNINMNQKFHLIKDQTSYNDINYTFIIGLDHKCHLLYQKTYINKTDLQLIKHEAEIYNTNFGSKEQQSFIVHSDSRLNENQITIPYFPFNDLKQFLKMVNDKSTKILFTIADKLVMIKEIAIGLEQLHEKGVYHQNLCSSMIMINSKKDSYIGGFSFDTNTNKPPTKPQQPFYYRHPDLIENPHNLIIDKEHQNREQNVKYDIYSFGLLMNEIITSISPESLLEKKLIGQKLQQLRNNYSDFIFSDISREDFDSKYEIPGIGAIIKKCITNNGPNIYSNMKEVISDVDKIIDELTPETKTEIDTRIKSATNSNDYECNLCDLVINYYEGNELSRELIDLFLKSFSLSKTQNSEDIITILLQFFGSKKFKINKESITKMLQDPKELQSTFNQFANHQISSIDIIGYINHLFFYYQDYISAKSLTIAYKKFLKEEKENNFSILQNKVIEKLNECQKNKQYFQVHELLYHVITNLLDQRIIEKKCDVFSCFTTYKKYSYDIGSFRCYMNSYNIGVDEHLQFQYQKNYYDRFDEKLIQQEIIIYNKDFCNEYPSFIVHSESKYNYINVKIPYFPNQTLRQFLINVNKSTEMKFTTADKLVMIKEIAIGLEQLHEKKIYHQNLCDSFIMINSKKDSYIGGFAFDFFLGNQQSKPAPSLYYRHPDLVKEPKSLIIDECVHIDQQSITYDIYAFGVLMYEIITSILPDSQFTNTTRESKSKILKNNKEFIFSKYEKEDFDIKYGIHGIRAIIEKCMSVNASNTYSNMSEVISSINEIINKSKPEIKTEVETRIKNAIDSKSYKCNFSDLVYSFYRGNELSKELIEKYLSIHRDIITEEQTQSSDNYDDDIITQVLSTFEYKNLDYTKEDISNILKDQVETKKFSNLSIVDFIIFNDRMFSYLNEYTDKALLISSYQTFLNDKEENSYQTLQEKIINTFTKYESKKYSSSIFELFSIIIENLLKQNEIQQSFNQKLSHQITNENDNETNYYSLFLKCKESLDNIIKEIKNDNKIDNILQLLSKIGLLCKTIPGISDDFNNIIKDQLIQPFYGKIVDLDQNQSSLMSLSIHINNELNNYGRDPIKYNISNCFTNLVPITSLDNFMKYTSYEEKIPIFLYFIARELSIIHSHDLYHGELSQQSIGVYYHSRTNTFIPLIIPFYYFFKCKQLKSLVNNQGNNTNKCISVEKHQRKDLKKLITISKEINKNEMIPLDTIGQDSANIILFKLENFFYENSTNRTFMNNMKYFNYCECVLTFTKIHEVFNCLNKSDEVYKTMRRFLLSNPIEGFLNLEETLYNIYKYLRKFFPEETQVKIDEKMDQIQFIYKIHKEIKAKNDFPREEYLNSNATTINFLNNVDSPSNDNDDDL